MTFELDLQSSYGLLSSICEGTFSNIQQYPYSLSKRQIVKSPLRYPGGKHRLVKRLYSLMPYSVEEYREPFVGGGSVFFYSRQQRPSIQNWWINDAYLPLIQFYQACSDPYDLQQLISWAQEFYSLTKIPGMAKRIFFQAKDNLERLSGDPSKSALLETAVRFFYVNRCSFSGSTEAGGFSQEAAEKRFTWSSIERLRPLAEILKDVQITHGDYEPVILAKGKNVFIYLDPPYKSAKRLYGKNGYLHNFDHERLAEMLKNTTHKWLLSYDDVPEIRELYKDFNIESFDLQYGMSTGGQSKSVKKGAELLIRNY